VQYQRLGLSHLGRALLDQGFAATPISTHNIACKPLPYVFAPLGLLTQHRGNQQRQFVTLGLALTRQPLPQHRDDAGRQSRDATVHPESASKKGEFLNHTPVRGVNIGSSKLMGGQGRASSINFHFA